MLTFPFEALRRDLRFGVRTLVRNPGFTWVAVLTIALGIGANSAMFSVVQGVILQPLPFPDADRLMLVWQNRAGVPELDPSYPNYQDWRRTSRSFDSMAGVVYHNFDLSAPGRAEHVLGIRASYSFLATLGIRPALGRDLESSDDVEGAAPVALISNALWRDRFGADPGVAGRPMVLDGRNFTIAGVLPAGFRFFEDAEVITPLRPMMPVILENRAVDALAVVAALAACYVPARRAMRTDPMDCLRAE